MDAILHGCIPVVVMDNVSEVFETILDWAQFSIRIPESDIEKTPEILKSIDDEQLQRMQRALAKVWHRFAWTTSPLHRHVLPGIFKENLERPYFNFKKMGYPPELPATHPFRAREQYPVREDAFHTLLQWLHSRIKDVR